MITIIGNPDTASAAGETVRVSLDTAPLVAASKMQSDGDDLRIVYWSGGIWTEVDRELFLFNTSSTDVWFPLQATIGNGTPDQNYYIYYGNTSAVNPPATLGTTSTLEFYSGDGTSSFQDAVLECGIGANTNFNIFGTGAQKSDQEDGDPLGCDASGFAVEIGLAEWSDFYGLAAWQVPTGARVVEDGTASGSRIRLWGAGNTGNKLEASAVLESWVDS